MITKLIGLLVVSALGWCSAEEIVPLRLGEKVPKQDQFSVVEKSQYKKMGAVPDPKTRNGIIKYTSVYQTDKIVFKKEETKTDYKDDDEYMTTAAVENTHKLVDLLGQNMKGYTLRITEAYDRDGEHENFSPHYDGRALDLTVTADGTTSDTTKLGLLAALAVKAGFDFVWYENSQHVHVSNKRR